LLTSALNDNKIKSYYIFGSHGEGNNFIDRPNLFVLVAEKWLASGSDIHDDHDDDHDDDECA